MTKQVKLAKILWQYRLSLPYHDYKPHMSCNKQTNVMQGSSVSSCHVANRPTRQEATACTITAYGCGIY
jgi:hypothetical protein